MVGPRGGSLSYDRGTPVTPAPRPVQAHDAEARHTHQLDAMRAAVTARNAELDSLLQGVLRTSAQVPYREREFFIDNLLVRIHFIIEMIWWTGLAMFLTPQTLERSP